MRTPQKTPADYLAIAVSPILIMLLVGSLAFFLIQVFYRGAMVHGIRWLMFWFVLAIVLVARIGIEQGKGHARVYGAALALATWLYLIHTHSAAVTGTVLLAVTWWCAHKLTVDCTLVRDDEDESGEGVLEGLWRVIAESLEPPPRPKPPPTRLEMLAVANLANRPKKTHPRKPGRWVIYFSLAALPLFGIGQVFLPADDPEARRIGFAFLAVYLSAALGLLMTTSFLGLRRYLRQRSVEMPVNVTMGWIRFGVCLAGAVLVFALVLPRPGANRTWKEITYRVPHKPHEASDYALPFNPPGEGSGAPATQPAEQTRPSVSSRRTAPGGGTVFPRREPSPPNSRGDQPGQPGKGGPPGDSGEPDRDARVERQQDRARVGDVAPEQDRAGAGSHSSDEGGEGGDTGAGRIRERPIDSDAGGGRQMRAPDLPAKELPTIELKERKPPAPRRQSIDRQDRPENPTPERKPPTEVPKRLLRALLLLVIAALLLWLAVRNRKALAQIFHSLAAAARSAFATLCAFLRKLFTFRWRRKAAAPAEEVPVPAPELEPFAAYPNPFLTGKDRAWPPERLLFYTYEAVQAWAKDQGIEIQPQQTPREFCARLIESFPDFGPELERFSFFYGYAAFAERLPADFDTEPIRRLWQYLGDSVAVVAPG